MQGNMHLIYKYKMQRSIGDTAELMALPVPIVQCPPDKDAAHEGPATTDTGKAAPAFW
jgi:hypothetical protein